MQTVTPGLNPFVTLPPHKASAIIEGLRSGSLYQDGGIIRESGTKRVFAFLKSTSDAVDPSTLGPLSSLVRLGSAASLMNLGVSVAGFALLYRKLNQVQDGIRLLDAAVRNGFAAVSNRLDSVEARLVGLHLLGLRTNADLARVEAKLDQVASQIDVAQFVPLTLALEQLSETSAATHDPVWFRAHAERAQGVRLYCLAMVERATPHELAISDARFVTLRAYVMVATMAMLAEARCLRAAGDSHAAIKRLQTTAERLLRPSQEVVLQLLDGMPAVLGARQIESAMGTSNAAAVARLLDPETSGDAALRSLREGWTERVSEGDVSTLAKLRSLRSEQDGWLARADAARQTAEVYEVLATLRAEYEISDKLNLSTTQWDRAIEATPEGEMVLVLTTSG